MLADLAVLDQDYFTVDEENIKGIESVLTIVGKRIVYAKDDFSSFSPEPVPILPDWSPTRIFEGPDFYNKHKFFEEQYSQLEEITDDVAERIRTLGHYAPATLKEFLELTHLSEQSREPNSSMGFIKDLLADHESILIRLRENINGYGVALHDMGSSDFITGLIEKHKKMAWMLRAHLA